MDAEDVIRHDKDGLLVIPNNLEALTAALSTLLKNDEIVSALGGYPKPVPASSRGGIMQRSIWTSIRTSVGIWLTRGSS